MVRSGYRYMMAWGPECGSWDDSVDIANLERFGFAEILDKEFVMTTWHEQETLGDVFHFAPTAATTYGQSEELPNALFLHLGAKDKRDEFEKRYEAATSIS